MKYKLSALAVSVSLISGCASYSVVPYGASVNNVNAIKSYNLKPVSVGKFQSSVPGKISIPCRAAGYVTVSPSFETYIEKAFIDELSLAGIYDPSSSLVITGELKQIDFSSAITGSNWSFTLTLTNSKNQSYTTNSKFEFSGSFAAEKACQQVAQQFVPAAQKLISDVVQDPKFRQIAN